MASQKIVALLVVCVVLVAAVQVIEAEDQIQEAYKKCLSDCEEKCDKDNNGYTFCEMKCDSDCGKEEFRANLESLIKS